ncbi:MAG: hypothetical protein JNL82_05725 [Myxococcales bacterium]|nr:hypothetical protein [Myxococcales bacterium]
MKVERGELAQLLQDAAAELNAAAVADENRDPFWQRRYGERGQRFMLSDGVHHFNYLAEAVRAGNPHVLEKYARWLRSVLVTRGMCSEHLADGFRVRAAHIAARGWRHAWIALDLLKCAANSLTYTDPDAAGIVPGAGGPPLPALAGLARAHGLELADVEFDARHLLSYLSDALAFDRPSILHDHLTWRGPFERQRGRPAAYLPDLLAALVPHLDGPPAELLRAAAEAHA